MLNTAALTAIGAAGADHPGVERGADGRPTGRLWRADAWLRSRLPGYDELTQPGFLAHRGDDFLRDVPAADRPGLYRCATLLRAGIPVALSSDAPFCPLDPWAVIAAAVSRRTASGAVAGPGERITFARALDAYLAPPDDPGGPPRRISPGLPADLVVLQSPLAQAARLPDPVRAVLVNGTIAAGKELSG
jgi:predicted amidohydrolase YtcJ